MKDPIMTAVDAALYVGAFIMLLNVTWIYYVAIIRLKYIRATLNGPSKFMAYLGLAVGGPLDIFLNLVFSILLLDAPREITLSQHLSRLKTRDVGWRGDAAYWICTELLDPFDPSGKHCS